jgi:CBS domain-containing protein
VTTVAEIMARDVLFVGPRALLVETAQRMQERHVGSALVFEDEQLRGILTERDLLRAVASGRIEGETVEDWMTRHPETIEPSDGTGLAGTLMIHGGFRHLPVLEGGRIVGIVSIRDLMRITLDDQSPRGA